MTEYKFSFNERNPIDVQEVYDRTTNNQELNARGRQRVSDKKEIELVLNKFFELYEIHYIEDALPQWNSEFDVRTINPFHGVATELIEKNSIPNYSIHFRTTLNLLRWIFHDINPHLRDISEKKIPNNIYDYIKNVKLTRTVTAQHSMLNTIQCDQIYWIQALYRAFIWHYQFQQGIETRWNLPVCIFAYQHGQRKFLNIHPGNTRKLFYDFKDIQFDSIVIVPKDDKNKFPKLDKFNYVDTRQKFNELLETHDIEYILDEPTSYAELFFVKKQDWDINAQTVLFFGSNEKRVKFSQFYKDMKIHHDGNGMHPEDHNSIYDITLRLDKGNIYVQDEHIAYLDDDCHLRFKSTKPKFLFN